jgi:hypothetical protein
MTSRAEEELNDKRIGCRADLLKKRRIAEHFVEDQIQRKTGKNYMNSCLCVHYLIF